MNGLAVLLVGLLLCFYGIRSLHLGGHCQVVEIA